MMRLRKDRQCSRANSKLSRAAGLVIGGIFIAYNYFGASHIVFRRRGEQQSAKMKIVKIFSFSDRSHETEAHASTSGSSGNLGLHQARHSPVNSPATPIKQS